jgi:exopolysaccharide biosynthesis protein
MVSRLDAPPRTAHPSGAVPRASGGSFRAGSAPARDVARFRTSQSTREQLLRFEWPSPVLRFMDWMGGFMGFTRKRVEVVPGLWLDDTRRTADGSLARVLLIDPRQVKVEAGFYDGKTGIPPSAIRQIPGMLAAINATFFGMGQGEATYGDLVGLGKAALDEDNPNRGYDQISDRRWSLASLEDGSLRFVKGGLVESGLPRQDVKGFIGGLGRLFGPDEAARLERDVETGAFRARLDRGVADRSFPNVDLASSIARTFVGLDAQGRLLAVTLGEGSYRAAGGNMAEGALLLKRLGAVEAYALDGGGSSHMLVPGKAETRTDGRLVKSYLVVRSAA